MRINQVAVTARARGAARTIAVRRLQRHPRLRRAIRRTQARGHRLAYRWRVRGRGDGPVIAFESFGGRRYAGSPRAVYEQMLRDPRFDAFRFVWALQDVGHADEVAALRDPRTDVVAIRTAQWHRAFGRACTWVVNSITPPELVPRDQLYVQTWHGTGIKRIGFDINDDTASALNGKAEVEDRYRTEAAKIDVFVSPAPFGTQVFTSAFGLPARPGHDPFVEIGNPRNDSLATATAADVGSARARLGLPDGARAILYAPTFRDDEYSAATGYATHQPFDLGALIGALPATDVVLLRAHYLATSGYDLAAYGDRVVDVSGVDEVNDLLLAADVLVTDYSSVAFDYLVLDRPVVFHLHDLDRYAGSLHGLYFPIEDLPGTVVRTQDELVGELLDPGLAGRHREHRQAALRTMCPHDDGHATERLLDLIVARLPLRPARRMIPEVSAARPHLSGAR